jgi:SSS family solute:Na+ symporter
MAITFVLILIILAFITKINPLKEPKVMPVRKDFDMRPTPSVLRLGITVIVVTVILYIIFW